MNLQEKLSFSMMLGSTEDHVYIMRYIMTMKKEVNGEALERAVKDAIYFFPCFSKRLSLNEDGKKLLIQDNPLPIVVRPGKDPFHLNTADTNFHMQGICYDKNQIFFDINHGFCDATGILQYIQKVIALYITYTENGIDFSKLGVVKRIDYDSQDAFYLITEDPAIQSEQLVLEDNNISIGMDEPREKCYYKLSMPEADFVQLAKKYHSSPATMVPAYLCKAIYEIEGIDTERIVGGHIAVNLRPFVGLSKNHPDNAATGVELIYDHSFKDKPVSEIAQYTRHYLKEVLESKSFLSNEKANSLVFKQIMSYSAKKAIKITSAIYYRRQNHSSFTSSYVGPVRWGELEEYVKSLYLLIGISDNEFAIEMNAVNHNFNITLMQSFLNDKYVKKIVELLEHDGISCELSEANALDLPILDMPKVYSQLLGD